MRIKEHAPSPRFVESCIREGLSLDPGGASLTVSGTCMDPALPAGCRIALRPPRGMPRVGEVVLLRIPAGLRLHRVLMRHRKSMWTKGDQGRYFDPRTTPDAVLAVWETNEPPWIRWRYVAFSVLRLFQRPWRSVVNVGHGEKPHVHTLP